MAIPSPLKRTEGISKAYLVYLCCAISLSNFHGLTNMKGNDEVNNNGISRLWTLDQGHNNYFSLLMDNMSFDPLRLYLRYDDISCADPMAAMSLSQWKSDGTTGSEKYGLAAAGKPNPFGYDTMRLGQEPEIREMGFLCARRGGATDDWGSDWFSFNYGGPHDQVDDEGLFNGTQHRSRWTLNLNLKAKWDIKHDLDDETRLNRNGLPTHMLRIPFVAYLPMHFSAQSTGTMKGKWGAFGKQYDLDLGYDEYGDKINCGAFTFDKKGFRKGRLTDECRFVPQWSMGGFELPRMKSDLNQRFSHMKEICNMKFRLDKFIKGDFSYTDEFETYSLSRSRYGDRAEGDFADAINARHFHSYGIMGKDMRWEQVSMTILGNHKHMLRMMGKEEFPNTLTQYWKRYSDMPDSLDYNAYDRHGLELNFWSPKGGPFLSWSPQFLYRCIANPRKDIVPWFNETAGPGSIHWDNVQALERIGLMDTNHTQYNFAFNYKTDEYYRIDDPNYLENVVDCGSSCTNYAATCTCKHKEDIFELFYELDMLYTVIAKANLRSVWATTTMLMWLQIFMALSLYAPPPKMLMIVCNRWVLRVFYLCIFYWIYFKHVFDMRRRTWSWCYESFWHPKAGHNLFKYTHWYMDNDKVPSKRSDAAELPGFECKLSDVVNRWGGDSPPISFFYHEDWLLLFLGVAVFMWKHNNNSRPENFSEYFFARNSGKNTKLSRFHDIDRGLSYEHTSVKLFVLVWIGIWFPIRLLVVSINGWVNTSVDIDPHSAYIMVNRTSPFNIPFIDTSPMRMMRYIDGPSEVVTYFSLAICSVMLMTIHRGSLTIKWEDIFEANKRYMVQTFLGCVVMAYTVCDHMTSLEGEGGLTQRHWRIRDYVIRLGRYILCGSDMNARKDAQSVEGMDPTTKFLRSPILLCATGALEFFSQRVKRKMMTYIIIKLSFCFGIWNKVISDFHIINGRTSFFLLFRLTLIYIFTIVPTAFLFLILSAQTTQYLPSAWHATRGWTTGHASRSSFQGIGRHMALKAMKPDYKDWLGQSVDFDTMQATNHHTQCDKQAVHTSCGPYLSIEYNRGGMKMASYNEDSFTLTLPRDNVDTMMCHLDLTKNRTHSYTTPYWDYYTDGTMGFESSAMLPNFHYRQNWKYFKPHLIPYQFEWPTSYWENPFWTMAYSITQLSSTAGFGDWVVNDTPSRFLLTIYGLVIAIVFDILFLNVWCSLIQDKIEEKSPYLQSSIAMTQSKTRSDENLQKRIHRSQAYLNIQWEKWHGLNVLSPESTELEIFPLAYQREFKYAILHSLLESRKSTILSQMTAGQLRHLSEEINYQTVLKGDNVFNSTIAQEFILIILNGQMFLESRKNEYVGALDSGHVHFEIESLIGTLPHCKIVSHSPLSEIFTIPRAHFLKVMRGNPDLLQLTSEINCKTYQRTSDVAVLDAHTKAFHGLAAPVLCQRASSIEDMGDVINYYINSKNLQPSDEYMIDIDNIDSGAADVLKTAMTYTERSDKASENAFKRTKERLLLSGILDNEILAHGETDEALLHQVYEDLSVDKQILVDNAKNASELKQNVSRAIQNNDLYPKDSNMHTNWISGKTSHEVTSSQIPSGFFHPKGAEMNMWSKICLLHSYYTFFLLTTQFGFANRENSVLFCILNYITIEGFWLVNRYIRSKTGVFDYNNDLTFEAKKISNHYRNVVSEKAETKALIPYEIILYVILNHILLRWTELPLMHGFFDYFYLFRLISKTPYAFSLISAKFDQNEERLFSQFYNNVFQWMLKLLALIHTLACFMYYAGCEGKGVECRVGSWAWMEFNQYKTGCEPNDAAAVVVPNNSYFKRWIVSCYWIAKTITCFNNANMLPYYNNAKIVSTVTMYCGMHFTNIVTALITTALISNIRKSVLLDFKSHIELVKFQIKNLSKSLQTRVLETKRLVYLTKGNLAAPGYFEPEDHLQTLDRVIIKGKTLEFLENYLPFFYSIPEVLAFRISIIANTFEYPAHQTVVSAGYRSSHVFILTSGVCEVQDVNGTTVGFFEAGQYFNFLECLSNSPSAYSIKTTTTCSIVDLKYSDLSAVLEEYPAWNFLKTEHCGVDMADKAKTAMMDMNLRSKSVSGDIQNAGPETPGHDGINPNGNLWIMWSAFNTFRTGFHACLALSIYSYFKDSNGALVLLLHFCDILALVHVFLNLRVQRQNQTTNMWPKTLAYSQGIYKNSCMIYDIITTLPLELIMGGKHTSFLMWNRVFQIRQAQGLFSYINNSIDVSSKLSFIRWVFYHIVWAFIGSSIMFGVAQRSSSSADTIELNTILNGHKNNITIAKKSWIGQAHEDDKFNDSFDFNKPLHLFVLGIYYISDCVLLIGTGQMYPQTTTEKVFELIIELGGWFCVMVIAAEFACIQTMSDMLRGEMEHYYYQIRELIQNTCADISNRNKLNISRAFEETWKLRAGNFADAPMKGLPTTLAKEVAHERYDKALGTAFANYGQDLDKAIIHASILVTTPKTFVVRRNSLQNYGYFIKSGSFKITTADKKAYIAGAGDYFVPDTKAQRGLWSVAFGEVVVLPLEKLNMVKTDKNNFAIFDPSEEHQHTTKFGGNDTDAFYLPNILFVLCGLFAFMIETYHASVKPRSSYLENNNNNATTTNLFLNTVREDDMLAGAFALERYGGFLLAAIILGNKLAFFFQHSRFVMFDKNESISLVACIIPIFFEPTYGNCFIKAIFLSFYMILLYTSYASKAQDLTYNIFINRFINYLVVALLACFFFSIMFLRQVCPLGVCKTDTFVKDFAPYQPFPSFVVDLDPEKYEPHIFQFLDSNGNQNAEISRGNVIFEMLHLTTSIFTTTGHGYITVKQCDTMVMMVIMSFVGKYLMATLLGLSNHVAGAARSSSIATYHTMRQKIKDTMGTLQTKIFAQRYLCGYLDAIFHQNSCCRLEDTLTPSILCSGVLKEFYYGFYRKCFADSVIFENISIPCLREIMSTATSLDTFYAGHVIQSAGVPLKGLMLVRNGCVLVGGENGWVAVNGDVVFNEPLRGDNIIVKASATAFAKSEIVNINLEKLMEIFSYYPSDYELYQKNIQKCFDRKFVK